jgi:hypothetical protein
LRELYGGVAPYAHPRCRLAQKRGLIGWDRLAVDYIVRPELGVVVQLAGEVQSPVPFPVALSQKSFEHPHLFRGLGRVGPKPLYERVLAKILWTAWSFSIAAWSFFVGHLYSFPQLYGKEKESTPHSAIRW